MSNANALRSLVAFSADLRRLPTVVAQKVATAAASAITDAARATFDAGEDAYGVGWVPKEDGTRATLKGPGRNGQHLADTLRYVAIGTKLRVALGVAYAKYVIGRRPVYPRHGAILPVAYSDVLKRTAVAVCKAELGR